MSPVTMSADETPLAAERVRAEEAVYPPVNETLPLLDVRVMFGAVTPDATASDNVAFELMVTELLPVTAAPKVTVDPGAVLAESVTL